MNVIVRAASALFLVAAPLAFAPFAIAQESENQLEVPPAQALQEEGETPWLYEGSDVPVDKEWLFGEMDNGLRYAVRRNGVPPKQISIRVRIDAGSLHERDWERGYAHLLEHLLFRESEYLGQAEAIAAWQRLGATFGSDANAETSPTHTAYKLDIPNIDGAKLEESFKLLSGMIKAPVLSEENVAAERPIVMAEKRERGGANQRVAELTRETFFAGQRLATRSPIGTVETLGGATGPLIQDFYNRWYRPENTVIVVAGDYDPMVLAGLVEKWFGEWEGTGEAAVAPDFGDPVAPEGTIAAAGSGWPIGEIAVTVEPDLPRSLTYAVMRPWRPVQDTIVYNEGLLIEAIAQAIINRRLEERARGGGSYLYAQIQQDDVSRSSDLTYVNFAPLTSDWQSALADVRGVIQDAINNPPTQEEIDREAAEYDVIFANAVEQASVEAGSELADGLIRAVDIRETFASSQTVLDVWRGTKKRLTPEEVLARTKSLFEGDVVRSVYVTPEEGEADAQALKLALAGEINEDSSARLAAKTITFDELPPIGEPGEVVSAEPLGVLDIERVEFANGVTALIWANDAEPGRVTAKVRFGAGYRGFDESNAVYAPFGEMALVSAGFGELGQTDIDRLATGRKLGFDFRIEDAVFTFTAQTRSADVEDQLYLFAAKLADPRWEANPVLRAKAAGELAYNSYATSPAGIINRDLEYLVADGDLRFATPDREALATVTPEGFRETWEPLLKQGPIEVLVFGEFDRDAIVEKLRTTFGALPPRDPIPAEIAARVPSFPETTGEVTVRTHRGDANQAAAVLSWKTGGGMTRIRESRQLEILTQLFSNRLLEALRERAGASYAPQAFAQWPVDISTGGKITAFAQIEPEFVPIFFEEAQRIARDMAENPVSEDEIERATKPLAEQIRRASTGNQFWLYTLEGASRDPQRVSQVRTILVDVSQTSPQIMRFLAERYFGGNEPFKLAVIPEGQELAQLPEDYVPAELPKPAAEPTFVGPPADAGGR